MHWSLGLVGFVLGFIAGALAVHNKYSDQIDDLRIQLCRLEHPDVLDTPYGRGM